MLSALNILRNIRKLESFTTKVYTIMGKPHLSTNSNNVPKTQSKKRSVVQKEKKRLEAAVEVTVRNTVEVKENINSDVLHSWCKTYPGCLPSLAVPRSNDWNFKIVSWNVNGLRAWLKSGAVSYVNEESPDILCIQETKCSLHKIPSEANLSGYKTYWASAEKEGYAGTGFYSKATPTLVTYNIGKSEHNKEGRVITAEYPQFFVVTAYVPNSGQGLVRLPYRQNQWDPDFLNYLKKLDAVKPVILCGDLNVAHNEIDLANPKSNHKSPGFTDEERADFTKLLTELDFVDTYRALYPDREKAYTFWNYRQAARAKNTGWRLDYFVVSKRLMDKVCDHEIRCGVTGSDHCPIVLYLQL